MYPYVASLKQPSLLSHAISGQLLHPCQAEDPKRQALLLVKSNRELTLYQIQGAAGSKAHMQQQQEQMLTHIVTQPIFTRILALKKLKIYFRGNPTGGTRMRQDLLFLLTSDLKMHLLHFNHGSKELEIISTFQIDYSILGGLSSAQNGMPSAQQLGGLNLKEVIYSTYDHDKQTVILVFAENYILTVNLTQAKSKYPQGQADSWNEGHCECAFHFEITNFHLTEIESKAALFVKKLKHGGSCSMGLLYDQRYVPSRWGGLESVSNPESQEDEVAYHLQLFRFHQEFEQGSNLATTKLVGAWLVIELSSSDPKDQNKDLTNSSKFYRFIYSQATSQLILIAYQGFIICQLPAATGGPTKVIKLAECMQKFIGNQVYIENLKWIAPEALLCATSDGYCFIYRIQGSVVGGQQPQGKICDLDNQKFKDVNPAQILCQLDRDIIFLASEHQNHQILRVNGTDSLSLLQEITNLGSISEMTKFRDSNSCLMLQKGQDKSRVYYLKDGVSLSISSSSDAADAGPQAIQLVSGGGNGMACDVTGLWKYTSSSGGERLLVSCGDAGTFSIEYEANGFDTKSKQDLSKALDSSVLTVAADERSGTLSVVGSQRVTVFPPGGSRAQTIDLGLAASGTRLEKARVVGQHIVAFDSRNTLRVFHVAGGKVSEMAWKTFDYTEQIHDIAVMETTSNGRGLQLAMVSFWNQSNIQIYMLPDLERPIHVLNLLDYVTFESFQIDRICFTQMATQNDFYILVALSTGFLIAFNFYASNMQNLLQIQQQHQQPRLDQQASSDLRMLFRLCNIFKVGDFIYDIAPLGSHVLICADQPKLLRQCFDTKTKTLECLPINFHSQGKDQSFDHDDEYLPIETAVPLDTPGRIACKIGSFLVIGTLDEELLTSTEKLNLKAEHFNYMVQKFAYLEDLDIMCLCCFDSYSEDRFESQGQKTQLVVFNTKDNKKIYSKYFDQQEKPSAIKTFKYGSSSQQQQQQASSDNIILVGTSWIHSHEDFSPRSGTLFVFRLLVQSSGDSGKVEYILQQNQQFRFDGAILDLEIMNHQECKFLLLAVNSTVMIHDITYGCDELYETAWVIDKQNYVTQVRTCKDDLILVADIMKSITVYRLRLLGLGGQGEPAAVDVSLVCRDPRGQWCMAMVPLDELSYLISDYNYNLILLTQEPSKQAKTFSIFGAMNMNQQVNCISVDFKQRAGGSRQEWYHPEDAFLSHQYLQSHALPVNQSFFDVEQKFENLKNVGKAKPILATADGGMYMTILLSKRAYQLLKALEDAMNDVVSTFSGHYSHSRVTRSQVSALPSQAQALQYLDDEAQAVGFLDGDFIELLLDLHEDDQIKVVSQATQSLMDSASHASKEARRQDAEGKPQANWSQLGVREVRMLLEHLRQIHQ